MVSILKAPLLYCKVGVNWDQEKLKAYPSRTDLDALACPKPVL